MSQDEEHVRLLSIFHYVVGGATGLFACFPLFHVAMGYMIATNRFPMPAAGKPPPPAFGWVFVVFGGLMVLLGWLLATCMIIAGRFLSNHTHYTYCLVIAGIECLLTPFGTVLGIFTIVVLMRPSVKDMFVSGNRPASSPPLSSA